MVSPSHAPNPMERVEETAHPRGKPGTPRNQTSNGLAMGHDQQSLLADSEITHSPPGPTHEILANPRFVISPRCLASLQDNLTNRRMRDPHIRWCERRSGTPGPPTRLSTAILKSLCAWPLRAPRRLAALLRLPPAPGSACGSTDTISPKPAARAQRSPRRPKSLQTTPAPPFECRLRCRRRSLRSSRNRW